MSNHPSETPERKHYLLVLGAGATGAILGVALFTPEYLLSGSPLLERVIISAMIGGILAEMLSYWIFPQFRKSLDTTQSKRAARIPFLQQYRYYTHPTNVPMFLGLLWFLFGILTMAAFPNLFQFENKDLVLDIVLFPLLFGWGLGGLMMLIRGETVDKNARKSKGFWAVFLGILWVVTGWGTLFVMTYFQLTGW